MALDLKNEFKNLLANVDGRLQKYDYNLFRDQSSFLKYGSRGPPENAEVVFIKTGLKNLVSSVHVRLHKDDYNFFRDQTSF